MGPRASSIASQASGQTVSSGLSLSESHHTMSYIADLAGQLVRMAKTQDALVLAYLLDMARIEAEHEAQRRGG